MTVSIWKFTVLNSLLSTLLGHAKVHSLFLLSLRGDETNQCRPLHAVEQFVEKVFSIFSCKKIARPSLPLEHNVIMCYNFEHKPLYN